MSVLTGKAAPEFATTAVVKNKMKEVKLADFKGKYVLLFFYPLDFTFVCPTELHAFQAKLAEFKKREVAVIGCSVDSQFSHLAWLQTPRAKGGIEGVEYPILADLGGKIARDYDVLTDGRVALRGLFLIDKQGIVQHQVVNNLPLGRSVDEALRMVDALRHFEKNGEVCPANWTQGAEAIEATAESVGKYLAKG